MNLHEFKQTRECIAQRLKLDLALIPSAGSRWVSRRLAVVITHVFPCACPFCSGCINEALLFSCVDIWCCCVYLKDCDAASSLWVVHDIMRLRSGAFPEGLTVVCLFPSVNLWTMFQAAQKLGGYELVSAHMCTDAFSRFHPGPSLHPSCLSSYPSRVTFSRIVSDCCFSQRKWAKLLIFVHAGDAGDGALATF